MNYFLICLILATVVALFTYYKKPELFFLTKPIPVLLLIIYLAFYIFQGHTNGFYYLILFGLIFGVSGDICLLFDKTFILGILLFLIGHILYILAFFSKSILLPVYMIIFIIAFSIIFGLFISIKMSPADRKKLIIPIWIYIAVITVMSMTSINFDILMKSALPFFTLGAVFFYVSDTLLSIDKFVKPNKIVVVFNLLTYYIAQSLILLGALYFKSIG